jgi:hypothetical protein
MLSLLAGFRFDARCQHTLPLTVSDLKKEAAVIVVTAVGDYKAWRPAPFLETLTEFSASALDGYPSLSL